MSATDCGKLHQRLVDTAMNDSAVKEPRPPDTIIFKPADLTRGEKFYLMDLLTSFMSMVKQMPDDARTRELYQDFLDSIFKRWTSDKKPDGPPKLFPLGFEAVVQVGILRDNHPGIRPPPGVPMSNLPVPPARMAGQPVFYGLELTLKEGGWRWFFMDRQTGFVDPQFVNMGGLALAEARRRVISKYDRNELKRITKYNLDLVVSVARRRIMKWAKYGSGHEAHIDPVDRLIPGGIQKLVLARDWISHWSRAALILTSEMPPSDEEIRMPPDEPPHQ
ncbi:hypothetical protein NCS57_00372800 [Fusarium keratoplasticum]|uniref:Uncharacterized protein n=1 Tax=Fusarium keratoplasticum TaxID=1328300 RepID=A0ACC0R360_9HYPO|nr:hypothetical protein NCS57_00372800 [Fusarium keratoplasticum]KAI8674740.1 hypothetical protein NCS57_00372800 [Fusarium keratoplasticum]